MAKNIQVAFFPGDGWHAYQQSMATALKKHNIDAYQGGEFNNNALINDNNSDILHFHWIERLWDADGFWQQIKLLVGVYQFLRLAKKRGKKIAWTVHNHYPHENARKTHVLGLKLFAKLSDAIYVHSEWSQTWVIKNLKPTAKPTVVYHGNFDSVFNYDVEANVYEQYKKNKVCSFIGILGAIRKNRGYEECIKNFKALGQSNLTLVIAGKSNDNEYLNSLKVLADNSDNIIFDIRHFTDLEYQQVSSSFDILLLNYTDITTSGALLSAWTNGTSVITSHLPYFTEIVGSPSPAGMVLNEQSNNLIQAINQLLSYSKVERINAAKGRAKQYDWNIVVTPLINSYGELLK